MRHHCTIYTGYNMIHMFKDVSMFIPTKLNHDDSYKLFYISLYLQHLQPLTILYSKTVHDDNVSYT